MSQTNSPYRCLIIGAGAIGQVYGYHLQQGGADVQFLVKPKYASEVKQGFRLYPLNKNRTEEPLLFGDFETVTTIDGNTQDWDYVVLCVSSIALQSGAWLRALALRNTSVITLQAGRTDYDFTAAACPDSDIISGMIPFTSYQAPLPTDTFAEPGVAYWFPPMTKVPFTGKPETTDPLVALLKRGGMPARRHPDVRTAVAFGQAILQTQVFALECAGWSLSAMHSDKDLMQLSVRTLREVSALAAHHRGVCIPWANRSLGVRSLTIAMKAFRRMAPMDLDAFFKFHYTKVHQQSMAGLAGWIESGRQADLEVGGLVELQQRLLG